MKPKALCAGIPQVPNGKTAHGWEKAEKRTAWEQNKKRPISWGIFLISGHGRRAWGVWMGVWGCARCPLHFPALREINATRDTAFQYYRSSMEDDFQPHCTFIFSVNIYKAQYLCSVVQGEEY